MVFDNLLPPLEDATCEQCKTAFQRRVFKNLGFRQQKCDACIKAIIDEEDRLRRIEEQRERDIEREKKWLTICPLIYRDTDLTDTRIDRKIAESVTGWNEKSRRGLGIIGTTGKGKTRGLFTALRRAFDAKGRVAFVSHAKFTRLAIDSFSGDDEDKSAARSALRLFRGCDVLLLDDIGKPPSTERADSELEELIEDRTSQGRAILWTANGSGEWLIKRFGIDRGEPLVRRLAEFSDVTTL